MVRLSPTITFILLLYLCGLLALHWSVLEPFAQNQRELALNDRRSRTSSASAQTQTVRREIEGQQENPLSTTLPRYSLRLDWTHLPPLSPLAKRIHLTQSQCEQSSPYGSMNSNSITFKRFQFPHSGLGSNLHVFSQSLCNAVENNQIMLTVGQWKWLDKEACDPLERKDNGTVGETAVSPLQCYFGRHVDATSACNQSAVSSAIRNSATALGSCDTIVGSDRKGVSDFRAASMEWLFQSVSETVIKETVRQIKEAFPLGLPPAQNLITVHMRWGDKKKEMSLQPVEKYIDAVKGLLFDRDRRGNGEKHRQQSFSSGPVHIYLSSEDPRARAEFKANAPNDWIIHTSGPTESNGNIMSMLQKTSSGGGAGAGLSSLGALLLSMEANGYVLTLASNWSRLINELRKNVVDTRCGNCTRMVDLLYDEW